MDYEEFRKILDHVYKEYEGLSLNGVYIKGVVTKNNSYARYFRLGEDVYCVRFARYYSSLEEGMDGMPALAILNCREPYKVLWGKKLVQRTRDYDLRISENWMTKELDFEMDVFIEEFKEDYPIYLQKQKEEMER